jgi:hypothetical protein
LVSVDHLVAAKRKLQAVDVTECRELEQTLLGRGFRPEGLGHALLPLPDRPYLTCIAKLPRPGAQLLSSTDGLPISQATGPVTK